MRGGVSIRDARVAPTSRNNPIVYLAWLTPLIQIKAAGNAAIPQAELSI
jgi:hypothetical protein